MTSLELWGLWCGIGVVISGMVSWSVALGLKRGDPAMGIWTQWVRTAPLICDCGRWQPGGYIRKPGMLNWWLLFWLVPAGISIAVFLARAGVALVNGVGGVLPTAAPAVVSAAGLVAIGVWLFRSSRKPKVVDAQPTTHQAVQATAFPQSPPTPMIVQDRDGSWEGWAPQGFDQRPADPRDQIIR